MTCRHTEYRMVHAPVCQPSCIAREKGGRTYKQYKRKFPGKVFPENHNLNW